ncbi:MAG: DUF4276 family protein [Prevotellaceae bacterium]|jgi:hypothetical protein|nr:DUF4276 family protein [Prevotellaceae bacterium]
MARLEILVEEPSMALFLHSVLPGLLPENWTLGENVFVRKHQGKSDLRKSVPHKLQAFSHWHEPIGVLIMQDQDSNDCKLLKKEWLTICNQYPATLSLIRIVCRELESWYLGDMDAVQQAFPAFKVAAHKNKAKFRNPESCNAKDELRKIVPVYQEMDAARRIAPYIDIEHNTSMSFRQFRIGLQKMIKTIEKK